MLTVLIMFIIGSFVASVLVIAAGMLSSRISQAQPMTEEYETVMVRQSAKNFTPRTYSVEIKA
jgi:hypothetical protein